MLSQFRGCGIALNNDINRTILILRFILLWDLNTGAAVLLDPLDLGSSFTNDIGAYGCWDGNLDGYLYIISHCL